MGSQSAKVRPERCAAQRCALRREEEKDGKRIEWAKAGGPTVFKERLGWGLGGRPTPHLI